jgi:hypothetical protein
VSDDLHSPTTAAPTPGATAAGAAAPQQSATEKVLDAAPEPVTQAAQSATAAASAARDSVTNVAATVPAERPELLAGAAFAGGLLAAQILKRLGR